MRDNEFTREHIIIGCIGRVAIDTLQLCSVIADLYTMYIIFLDSFNFF